MMENVFLNDKWKVDISPYLSSQYSHVEARAETTKNLLVTAFTQCAGSTYLKSYHLYSAIFHERLKMAIIVIVVFIQRK